MPSLSTHVLDAAAGGPRPGIPVSVRAEDGSPVASGVTDADGRIGSLASGLAPGRYRIEWSTGDAFVQSVAVTVDLADERHYHVPLLASPVAAVAYLGV